MMPPARYALGPGVAELMAGARPGRRRSLSEPDLQGAAARSPAGAAGGSPLRPQSPAPTSMHHAASELLDRRGGGGKGGAEESEGFWYAGGGMHRRAGGSADALDIGEEEDPRLRRRSIMVGELLFRLQQEAQDAAAGGAGGGEEAGPAADAHARRSSLQDHTPAGRRRALTPPPDGEHAPQPGGGAAAAGAADRPRSLVGDATGGADSDAGLDVSLHGGMAPGPVGVARTAEGDCGGEARGRPRSWGSLLRRSVAVAEVLHYQESKMKVCAVRAVVERVCGWMLDGRGWVGWRMGAAVTEVQHSSCIIIMSGNWSGVGPGVGRGPGQQACPLPARAAAAVGQWTAALRGCLCIGPLSMLHHLLPPCCRQSCWIRASAAARATSLA